MTNRSTGTGNFFLLALGATAGSLAGCGGSAGVPAGPPAQVPTLTYSDGSFVYLADVIGPAITPVSQPSGTTGFSISPPLPAGLLLDPLTGAITGIPTDPAAPTVYTITALGADLTADVELEVRDSFGAPRFAFGLDWGQGRIQTWRVDGESGELVAGATSPADQFPFRGAADPLGRFLYVAHFGTGSIGVYEIDQETGAATIVQLLQLGSATVDLTISPDGRFLYAADFGLDVVALFEIDATTGLLAPTAQLLPISDPSGLALSSDGQSLYVASLTGNLIAAFDLDPVSGGFVSARGTVMTPGPFDLALTPDGSGLYTCNFGVNAITAIGIDGAGVMTRLDSYLTAAQPVSLSASMGGERLTVSTFAGGTLESFKILADKRLTATSVLSTGGNMASVAELGVADRVLAPLFDRSLAATALPATALAALVDGTREMAAGNPVDLIPVSTSRPATLAPDRVYSANISAGDVSALAFDEVLAQLDSIAAPKAAGAKPSDLAISPDGRFLYVAEELAGQVLGFRLDSTSGALSQPIATANAGFLVRALAISGNGKRLIAAGNSGVTLFDVDVTTGQVVELDTTPAGLAPDDVDLDASGRFVYVANRNSGDISVFDTSSGSLIEIAGSPFDNGLTSGPRSLSLSPDGGLLAVSSSNLNRIRVQRVDRNTGALSFAQDLIIGLDPRGLDWSLDGRNLYVALADANAVAVVARADNDALSLVTTHSAGLDTKSIDVDPSGELLYAAAFNSNTIEVFAIGAAGSLTHVDSAPLGAGAGPDAVLSRARWRDLE
ncbi:beta-propeller fold lactonase family protein [Engelhardtia mirabilis]|uniref:6-phosphogluconolactonase n=1 Tax=Engelhardtia mirabilis TaxID=2528011 RepID=A0A518BMR7_9BACT|nr:6-phosphogluconolactonase [Planctomycetes bacterium Pla133]QDV02606.1 6-phosphogluconolactonase [Planctomycetes bacterium Pla86]